ncbi:cobalt ECF transporter T component CbiQ [Aetokthonos hydrillicola Thurmond2011]|jgi:cobalt/nickel transport system permease protein|uniref:Cobalt ECF transporter T component CbiQ n=1 Tax=Aetokthonos hydrillicola Thurmond2011 TaxID=2712845 RepID=A0AAP5M7X4_9CYAN|nr:cobalt ECF transporter T component CbiQ [Aetokthonos hydrillicola]MBO3458599.1 cobalt ECF transporter T component CbiQ [Aetokthonos hydrillicola CCALA 1050]MBW4585042.1 cobalt ECF transporter T component CbiQ [Aetokthonos hydrillicola CCALA 1050]MDR9894197.1 cobalt ECF transporter T component CbiQ [Aetokthonos hydrillicola Thurmond2011]
MLLHIGAFHLDIDSQRVTPWHKLTPRIRILCTVLFVFAIVLTPNGHWWTWGIYGLTILNLVWLSQVTLIVLVKRLAVEFSFIGVVLLGTLFRDGGKVLWSWGSLKITTLGLTILGSVTLKAMLSLLILNVLTLTTSVPVLLQSMIELRIPPLLVAILSSMYRYIGVLVGEFNAMRRAAASRNLMSNKRWQRLVMGNMIGSLFIRTYGRGERVYYAMISRGYQGVPSGEKVSPTRRYDILALSLTAILVLLGQVIYIL